MTILAFGTFDVLHIGHIHYLKQARKIAKDDKLIVIVSRDKNAFKFKHKKLIHNENERLEIIQNLRIVDKAILGSKDNIYLSVKRVNPKIVVLGYDQAPSDEILAEKFRKYKISAKIIRARPFEQETKKSSKIKKALLEID